MSEGGRGPYPPFYFLLAVGVMVLFHRVVPGARFIREPATLVGVMPFLVGLGLMLTTVAALRRGGTTIKPFETPTALLTEGTFRVSRNPIYLGMVLMLFGVALTLGTATPFAVTVVFGWWMQTRFIRHEEAALHARFGDAYRQYQAGVRRWI
jgi:protein-S-isoprenylcysteine O-methyltransferase Ste14